jgi:hypothetical protein
MAIIKYTLDSNFTPAYISDGGYWKHTNDRTYIGIGSGGGTELTVAQLKAYAKGVRDVTPNMRYVEWESDGLSTSVNRAYTDAEMETHVDDWCTAKGI